MGAPAPAVDPDDVIAIVNEFNAWANTMPMPSGVLKGIFCFIFVRLRQLLTTEEAGMFIADAALDMELVMETRAMLRAEQWHPNWDGTYETMPDILKGERAKYAAYKSGEEDLEDFTIVEGQILGADGQPL